MKRFTIPLVFSVFSGFVQPVNAQTVKHAESAVQPVKMHMFIDVHHLKSGTVTYAAVSKAHAKDLATEAKYGVHFINFWVDEKKGLIYCLSTAPDSAAVRKTHAEAHGLLPDQIYLVTEGKAAAFKGNKPLFLDIHELGAGNVKASDVVAVHQKDLAVEEKYGVNLINYWVDEKNGRVMCLSQANDTASIVNMHREAHGLLPANVYPVKQGK